ncbi:MAG: aminopeptidase P family protein [Nitrososphaerota archaeon]|nr:aminopeptidase P family protein [Nitrososphaerota archaeon]
MSRSGPTVRRDRLHSLMDEFGLSAAVLSDPKTVYYLSGFVRPSVNFVPAYLVLRSNGEDVLVTGETVKASASGFDGRVTTFENYALTSRMLARHDYAASFLYDVLKGGEMEKVGVESWHTPEAVLGSVRRASPGSRLVDLSKPIEKMRALKDPDEVRLIEKSCRLVDYAYKVAKSVSSPGVSELEVYASVQKEVVLRAGGFQYFSGDFKAGARSEDPNSSGEPTRALLRKGRTLMLDLWATTKGYWADTCRTFLVGGSPTREQERAYRAVKKALKAGADELRPGARASEVYRVIDHAITDSGYGGHFPHHGGHCVGLDAWEPPFIIPGSNEVLEAGMVCALEPGIYLRRTAGVCLEDNYLVTHEGPVPLSKYPLSW